MMSTLLCVLALSIVSVSCSRYSCDAKIRFADRLVRKANRVAMKIYDECSPPATDPPVSCPSFATDLGFEVAVGKCFLLATDMADNYDVASQACASVPATGRLLVYESLEQETYFMQRFPGSGAFVGARLVDGVYQWSTGDPVNGAVTGGLDCVTVDFSSRDCSLQTSFLCEIVVT